jgi:hypothetical protein
MKRLMHGNVRVFQMTLQNMFNTFETTDVKTHFPLLISLVFCLSDES